MEMKAYISANELLNDPMESLAAIERKRYAVPPRFQDA